MLQGEDEASQTPNITINDKVKEAHVIMRVRLGAANIAQEAADRAEASLGVSDKMEMWW